MSAFNILTITQITSYLKSYIDENPKLSGIYVRGEITNFKGNYYSGHFYFTLKDEASEISCVMFKNYAERLRFPLKDGMVIIARCDLSVYQKSGSCQLYVYDAQPDGVGSEFLAIEELKAKLSAEGLFDIEHKKPIPYFPERIGVVTSAQGAAIHDIENVLKRRWPIAKIILTPVLVQGEFAPQHLVDALKIQDSRIKPDVIIIGRGGGSAEDLFAFNNEELARTIYNCKTPIISAVGHEVDYSISDFVADLRAATPSAAAELVAPDINEITQILDSNLNQLKRWVVDKCRYYDDKIENCFFDIKSSVYSKIQNDEKICIEIDKEILRNTKNILSKKQEKLLYEIVKLDKNNPAAMLKKTNYIIDKHGKKIKSINDISIGDNITILLNDGAANAKITEKKSGVVLNEKES